MAKRKKNKPIEYYEQRLLFKWAAELVEVEPKLWFLNASLNGVRLSMGQAIKAKKSGMKRGFPDIQLPVPNDLYLGLFIELKKPKSFGKNYPSMEQRLWIRSLEGQGHRALVCWGFVEAANVISEYLALKADIENYYDIHCTWFPDTSISRRA